MQNVKPFTRTKIWPPIYLKKSFTTYDYTYGATGALNWWWGSDYCKTNDELLHHLPFTWKTDLSKYFIIFPISQWGSRDVWCEQLVASKTISEARTESNWEVSLSQKNFFTLCLYRPGWTLGSFLVNQYQVVKYELVQCTMLLYQCKMGN